jgi:hypothetical protein
MQAITLEHSLGDAARGLPAGITAHPLESDVTFHFTFFWVHNNLKTCMERLNTPWELAVKAL